MHALPDEEADADVGSQQEASVPNVLKVDAQEDGRSKEGGN